MNKLTPRAAFGIDVVVLAGGWGTRLKSALPDTPKILAPVNGTPLLDHLLRWLDDSGVERVIFALGHLSEKVQERLKGEMVGRWGMPGAEIISLTEPEPRGTAAALVFVASAVKSDPVLVVNGDTLVDVDLPAFARFHRATGAEISIVHVDVDDAGRYGQLEINGDRVMAFKEKRANADAGKISAGVYLFSRTVLESLVATDARSIEKDLLERAPPGSIATFPAFGGFIDIGTPESLALAVDYRAR